MNTVRGTKCFVNQRICLNLNVHTYMYINSPYVYKIHKFARNYKKGEINMPHELAKYLLKVALIK